MTLRSKTLTISIESPPIRVYAFILNPENLPKWATTFCKSVRKAEGDWIVDTPDGTMKIKFVEQNKYGVLDHYVYPGPGLEILNPMRVVPNGSGSEIIFTLFQPPGMADEKFDEDTALVEHDLKTLKNVLEG